jgi:alpha/beta superfamily hydrolase
MIAERPLTVPVTPDLSLEAALALPAGAQAGVVVCHPHPLHGGDMDSPVVMAVVAACGQAGLGTLRFNFRGVGDSGGAWDEGRGEQQDVRAALDHLHSLLPAGARLALAGYSFGSMMAAAVAGEGRRLGGLALIAPPLGMRPLGPLPRLAVDGPLLVVAGSADQYCPASALAALGQTLPKATLTVLDGVDHFFFGGLDRLGEALGGWATAIS